MSDNNDISRTCFQSFQNVELNSKVNKKRYILKDSEKPAL